MVRASRISCNRVSLVALSITCWSEIRRDSEYQSMQICHVHKSQAIKVPLNICTLHYLFIIRDTCLHCISWIAMQAALLGSAARVLYKWFVSITLHRCIVNMYGCTSMYIYTCIYRPYIFVLVPVFAKL